MIIFMALAYLVQHGEKEPLSGDPALTPAGRRQADRTGRWLHGRGVHALYTSPCGAPGKQPTAPHRSPGSRSSPMPGCGNV